LIFDIRFSCGGVYEVVHRPFPMTFLARVGALFLAAAAISAPAAAQAVSPDPLPIQAGMVQPSVKVLADAAYSYALYLPSKYAPRAAWPLLIAFDPGGEGEYPVRLFQPAAEKYGFIVVGSNNSRNFEDPSAAIRLLWRDVTRRYAIDPHRVYATGFSGGSRVAVGLAIGCKCLTGVIACGAGLPAGSRLPPAETADWFLTAGKIDFNYAEMIQLADAMDARHAATHLAFFEGPHSWMPPAVADEALAWMQLRAMARGLTPVDRIFVEGEFRRQMAAAESLRQSSGALAAFRAYRGIVSDFRSLRDIKDAQAALSALAASDELKRARKGEQALMDLQERTALRINAITSAIIDRQKAPAMLYQDLASLIGEIRRDRETTKDGARRDALTRALFGAFAFARETGSEDQLKKDYLPARDLFMAASIIRPESAGAHYLIAAIDAQLGEIKPAIDELNRAADLGLSDPHLLESAEFDKLRKEPAFREVTAKISARNKTKP
jgi:dienelactone hydrolase